MEMKNVSANDMELLLRTRLIYAEHIAMVIGLVLKVGKESRANALNPHNFQPT